MELSFTATGCHFLYGITQCYLPPDTSEHTCLNPSYTRWYSNLSTTERWKGKAELTLVTDYILNILKWFTCPQTVTHPNTNPIAHGGELNSQSVGHKSDAITISKSALMAFDCVDGQGPGYFDDVLVPVHTVGDRARLRSSNYGDMVVPRLCTVRFGQCSFRSSAPSVWNDLPSELRAATLIVRVLNLALSHGFFSVPTRNRHLCELCLRGII